MDFQSYNYICKKLEICMGLEAKIINEICILFFLPKNVISISLKELTYSRVQGFS